MERQGERRILDTSSSANTEIRGPGDERNRAPIYAQVSAIDARLERIERWIGWLVRLLERWFPG